jgi:hypothetical protein
MSVKEHGREHAIEIGSARCHPRDATDLFHPAMDRLFRPAISGYLSKLGSGDE